MIGNKVLTVCEYGNSRSVGCAFMLKEKYGKDAIACGIRRANPDTFDMLCEWADSIVVTVGHLRPEINPKYNDKVLLWDVGHDRYFIPPVPELLEQYESYYSKLTTDGKKTLIPKKVFTAWLSDDGSMPELIRKCIDSQIRMCEEFGYEHHLITLDTIKPFAKDFKYLRQAFGSQHPAGVKYCKMTDYLRMLYLKNGGIFLDADVEILPGKSFDEILSDKMFIGLEVDERDNGKAVLGTAVLGSEPNHPFLNWILNEMETKFSGADNLNYESSMDLLNIGGVKFQDQFTLYGPEYFYPKNSMTGELNVTDKTVCIHQFTKLWTPETNAPKSLIEQLTYNIENGINFTFVKRGDGELACMAGEPGGNCDGHPYSKELGDALINAYQYLEKKGATIVEFYDQEKYNILLHRTDSDLQKVSAFYKAVAASAKTKYFIGPKKLSGVSDMLGAKHIVIPEINWWQEYNSIMSKMPLEPDCIYLFCAGMPAKVLIHDIMQYEFNSTPCTYLDCGSAFDPAVSQTRTFQISKEEFWALYEDKKWDTFEDVKKREEFEASLPVNNFCLPQETHPERLWVLNRLVPWKLIYDFGCGANKTVPEAVGFDVRPVSDITVDITGPFTGASPCDIIISRHSFEHLLDPAKAMKNWIDVLKPCGKMLIILPDHEFINTLDPVYSAGQHWHAYTRESFANFISLFPSLYVASQETVLKDWSFGTVVYKLPRVSIIIPQLGREEGLKKCLESIRKQDYPENLLEVIIIDGEEETVPQKVAKGVAKATGDYFCYAANDMTFEPDAILTAVKESLRLDKGLVSFNSGPLLPDKGNINEHFIISRELVKRIGGYIFDLSFYHVGADNYLYQMCDEIGQALHSENAKVVHRHFSNGGSPMDAIYNKGWAKMEEDRKTLQKKIINKLKGGA